MVIIIVAVVACLAAFAAFQEAVACQEETCQASSADILVVVHHIAQEEVACLPAQTTRYEHRLPPRRYKHDSVESRHLSVQNQGHNIG